MKSDITMIFWINLPVSIGSAFKDLFGCWARKKNVQHILQKVGNCPSCSFGFAEYLFLILCI